MRYHDNNKVSALVLGQREEAGVTPKHSELSATIADLWILLKAISAVLVVCILYAFLIHEDVDLDRLFAPYFSLLMIPLLSFMAIFFMMKSHHSFADYGFSLNNAAKSLRESLLCTMGLMCLALVVKALYLRFDPSYAGYSLFSPSLSFSLLRDDISYLRIAGYIIIYLLFSPLQEMLARGFMQGLLYKTLSSVSQIKRTWFSIILANLLFGFTHLHLTVRFAIVSMFVGLLWGWLYSRHQTLIGVSVCHALIGIWCLFIVGFHP